jgi:hypothetical protein
MITIKTKVAKPILDDRWNKITDAEIYLTIERLEENINHVIGSGFYYYKVPYAVTEGETQTYNDVVLTSFSTRYTWEQIAQVEEKLPPMQSAKNYKDNTLQRAREFAIFQQEIESGKNFGITFDEWDV